MVLHWIRREFPVLFSQLDEAFGQPHGILKQNVRVDHAMTDEQRALESLRKIYRRALTVRVRILLWHVQNVRRVAVIVVRPVGYWSQRRACRKDIRRCE